MLIAYYLCSKICSVRYEIHDNQKVYKIDGDFLVVDIEKIKALRLKYGVKADDVLWIVSTSNDDIIEIGSGEINDRLVSNNGTVKIIHDLINQ